MIQNDVVSPTLNTNEASLGIATVGIAFHLDPSIDSDAAAGMVIQCLKYINIFLWYAVEL